MTPRVVKCWTAGCQWRVINNKPEEARDGRCDSTKTHMRKKKICIQHLLHLMVTVSVTSSLPLGPKCTLQDMLCDKQQNPFKHFSFNMGTMLSFLSTGCGRSTAGETGCPAISTKGRRQVVWVRGHLLGTSQPWTQNAVPLQPCSLIKQ